MPKILPELRDRFIAAAKKRLLEDEGHDVSIRQIARDCGTAVGTVYNYFSSKEALLAAVMMEDWMDCCRRMRQGAAEADRPLEALRAETAALRRFTARYAPLWRNYAEAKGSIDTLSFRHRQIIAELIKPVEETLQRFGVEGDAHLPEVLAELVLFASRTDDGFDRIQGALEKILA